MSPTRPLNRHVWPCPQSVTAFPFHQPPATTVLIMSAGLLVLIGRCCAPFSLPGPPPPRRFRASGASRRKTFQHFLKVLACVCVCARTCFSTPHLSSHALTRAPWNWRNRFFFQSSLNFTSRLLPLLINTRAALLLGCCDVMDFPASLHPSPTGSTHRPHQEQKKKKKTWRRRLLVV